MKCVRCNKDAKKKDRDERNGHCPSCNHPFVADPSADGFTDKAIKAAEERVSNNGLLYFSKAHLKYQLHRKLKKNIRKYNRVLLVFVLIFLATWWLPKGGFYSFLMVASGAVVLTMLSIGSKAKKSIHNLDRLVSKWARINPHPKMLSVEMFRDGMDNTGNNNLDGISFDRVLICDRNETVDFLLSNLFHFHYACPVLGGTGYPYAIFSDMLRRLKENPDLKVFLLHDHSARGRSFVSRIRTDPRWFGGPRRYNIIDLGLTATQKKLFAEMTVRQNGKITAEVALFTPAMLMALCGAAINEGVPLDMVSAAAAADRSDGYG